MFVMLEPCISPAPPMPIEPNMPDGGGGVPYAAAQLHPAAYRFRPPRRPARRAPTRPGDEPGSRDRFCLVVDCKVFEKIFFLYLKY